MKGYFQLHQVRVQLLETSITQGMEYDLFIMIIKYYPQFE